MSIQLAGLVYCPLSPEDPAQRVQTLIEESRSHLVLVHSVTKTKFTDDIMTLDIDKVISSEYESNDKNHFSLSKVDITSDDIAYIIFTSGSTGTPKAVSLWKM